MFFTIGIETPKKDNESYGIIVPALCNNNYSCFSALPPPSLRHPIKSN